MASQKRSRLTVDALVEATARVLTKEGYDRASTNKIAAMAGVSIGSLYQYFPSKEALVAAVIERHTQELSRVVRDTLLKVAARPIEIAVRELVAAGLPVLMATHDLERAADWFDRLVVIDRRVLAIGTPDEVLKSGAYAAIREHTHTHGHLRTDHEAHAGHAAHPENVR